MIAAVSGTQSRMEEAVGEPQIEARSRGAGDGQEAAQPPQPGRGAVLRGRLRCIHGSTGRLWSNKRAQMNGRVSQVAASRDVATKGPTALGVVVQMAAAPRRRSGSLVALEQEQHVSCRTPASSSGPRPGGSSWCRRGTSARGSDRSRWHGGPRRGPAAWTYRSVAAWWTRRRRGLRDAGRRRAS